MTVENRYKQRYASEDTPWDTGKPDFNLIDAVTQKPIPSCKAIDVGCGTGDNCIWLARKGFSVIGTDVSEIAIEKAKEKASNAETACHIAVQQVFAITGKK